MVSQIYIGYYERQYIIVVFANTLNMTLFSEIVDCSPYIVDHC